MEFKQIQELLKQVNKSNISEVSIKDGEFELTIKQATASAPIAQVPIMQHQQMPAMQAAPQVQQMAPQAVTDAPAGPVAPVTNVETGTGNTIKSPMIGTFYRSSAPDKPPFVNVGDEIKPGDVLCIVEAMKLFNEIESEVSGRIVKVLVDDGTPVEYDQPLFIVE